MRETAPIVVATETGLKGNPMADSEGNEFLGLALGMERRGVPAPEIIADLMIAAGMVIAGAAKSGREASLIDRAVGVLRRAADEAHVAAEGDGIHLTGRDT